MKDSSQKFRMTRRHEAAIIELLNPANKSKAEIAKKLNISERTLYNWLRIPEFQSELRLKHWELRENMLRSLHATSIEALRGLQELTGSEDESIKLKACQAIIEFCLDNRASSF
jgi:hypothetical protein